MNSTPTQSRRLRASSHTLGVPALLVTSVAALALMVLVIALVGATNAGWAVVTALIVHLLATAVVIVAVMRMLDNADRADP